MGQQPSALDCAACRAALTDYVSRELADLPLDGEWAAITDHLEECAGCEALYDREFRRQGLALPLAALQQVGRRAAVAGVMDQILAALTPAQPEPARPGWRPVRLEHGQGWVDRATESWRRVELFLGSFLEPLGGAAQPAPAWAGLMSAGADLDAASAGPAVTPEGANFELYVAVTPRGRGDADAGADGAPLCDLEATLTLYDRFGDYSGVEVTLLHGTTVRQAVTDSLGKVRFEGLAYAALAEMRLVVHLPE
ncbi:MAG: hypothetical protein IT329_08880 [Caldilineaceae bacterium]|nr:hypothetical protein [Caldilineaceae bacterium]